MTFLADIIQNPSKKKGVALVITGRKGTGKTKVFDHFQKLLGRYAVKVTHPKQVTGSFNAHQEDKLLIVADEAICSSGSRSDVFLKDLITSESMQIEGKGKDARNAQNFMRMVIISNDEHVVRATQDERRYFVLRCGEGNMQDHEFFAALDEQMKNGGLEALMYALVHYHPKDGWDVLRKAPETPHLRTQQALTLSPLDQFIVDLIKDEGFESDDGSVAIDLAEVNPTEVPLVDLRKAAQDYMSQHAPQERMPVGFEQICASAHKMIGAKEFKRPNPNGPNQLRFLEFPPLASVRETLKFQHGIEISDIPSRD